MKDRKELIAIVASVIVVVIVMGTLLTMFMLTSG